MFEKVLARLRPGKEEREKSGSIAKALMARIRKEGYRPVLVGSRARDTFIAGDRDLDIFVYFPRSTRRPELEKKGVALGKKVLAGYDPVVHYAEHPYVKGVVDGLTVEIVPCYHVKEKIISAVDRSPLHNEFVLRRLKKRQCDQVRLLKQFMKAADAYGADTKTHGFSGYLCELLILRYGDFRGVVRAAARWEPGVVIDLKKLRRDYSKFEQPLIVVDPVDAERNVAAAVSRGNFDAFIARCRQFLKTPSEKFFFPPAKRLATGAEARKPAAMVVFDYPRNVVEEIVWSQLERLAGTLTNLLRGWGFMVKRSLHWTDGTRCGLLFEFDSLTIPAKARHAGPPVGDEANCRAFKEKNRDWHEEGGRLWAWKPRRFTSALKALEAALSEGEAIPSHLAGPVRKARLLSGSSMLRERAVLEGLLSRK